MKTFGIIVLVIVFAVLVVFLPHFVEETVDQVSDFLAKHLPGWTPVILAILFPFVVAWILKRIVRSL